jgi:hypothetical protein
MIQVSPFIEEVLPETGSLDGFQKLFGNDGVGVDIGPIQRRHQSLA